jgi:D-cysteine desulfhydrase
MIPRLRFAHLPTAVEAMPRLSELLGGPRLLVKRDDQTGLAFGGNKIRKLEFLVGEAQAQGARTLVTAGAVQSNHCRQTAAAAARFGFDCILVLAGEKPPSASGNLLLDGLFGARIVWAGGRERRESALAETFEQARAEGRSPYLVPYGGSSPTGALGYAFAMEELLAQQAGADWIVLASSSGGTQAGLVLGARAFGYDGRILGISVDEPRAVLQELVAKLAGETSARLGPSLDFDPGQVMVNDDFAAPGYGVLTEAERQAIALFAAQEGLLLDPVYTGRAAAGLVALIRAGFFAKDEIILFWHTGGGPALFAEDYERGLQQP